MLLVGNFPVYYESLFNILPISAKTIKTIRLMITIPAPVGTFTKYEAVRPAVKQATEIAAEHIVTPRKLLQRRMDVREGKIIRLDISSAPIRRIPTTITTAVSTEMNVLYIFVRMPVALEKLSSNVTAKMR